jgi:hypothetical protein
MSGDCWIRNNVSRSGADLAKKFGSDPVLTGTGSTSLI